MLFTTDAKELRNILDEFDLPMFVAELRDDADHDEFVLLANNTLHEQITGLRLEDLTMRRPSELLPADQAREVNRHYGECVDRRGLTQYSEILNLPEGPIVWDTTLRFLDAGPTCKRIIGSATCLQKLGHDMRETAAFEDVQWHAVDATYKISKLSALTEAILKHDVTPTQLINSAQAMDGLLRMITENLYDIRKVAEDRLSASKTQGATVQFKTTRHCRTQRLATSEQAVRILLDLVGDALQMQGPQQKQLID
jgi:hypothetical protein